MLAAVLSVVVGVLQFVPAPVVSLKPAVAGAFLLVPAAVLSVVSGVHSFESASVVSSKPAEACGVGGRSLWLWFCNLILRFFNLMSGLCNLTLESESQLQLTKLLLALKHQLQSPGLKLKKPRHN